MGGAIALALLSGGDDGGGSSGSADSAAERRREERAQRREERAQRQQDDQGSAAPAPSGDAEEPGAGSDYKIPESTGTSDAEGARLQLEGHNMLGSDPEGAVKVLERSVAAFPPGTDAIEYQYALFSLGKGLRLSDRPEDAIPVLEKRLEHPNQRDVVQRELDLARAAAGRQ